VPDIETFDEWDLGDDVQGAIKEMGITKPSPIQALAIGHVLAGKDVIAKAETGTGKTLAFGAPMMARIDPDRASVLGLVLSPTRELAEQVYKVLEALGEARGVKVALIVGGEPLQPQVKELHAGAQVVVGTPGRVLDLMNQGFLTFPWAEFAILDEADKMLEIGFVDDVKKILAATEPEQRQTLLFSATFPPALLQLARDHTTDPAEIATASGVATVDTISQYFLKVTEENRARALSIMINDSEKDDVFLVFCDRRTDVDKLMRLLERERFPVKALHGGYDQAARFRVMAAFRTGDVKTLVATDVASRGLDVNHVTHVVNFGVPRDVSDYTHRIGRTGRAGRTGTAVTLVGPSNDRYWRAITGAAPWDIPEIASPYELATAERQYKKPEAEPEPEAEVREEREPRREREPRGERKPREERKPRQPREERQPEAKQEKPQAAAAPGGFGAGLEAATPKPKKKRAKPAEPKPERAPEPEPPTDTGGSDFGAGL